MKMETERIVCKFCHNKFRSVALGANRSSEVGFFLSDLGRMETSLNIGLLLKDAEGGRRTTRTPLTLDLRKLESKVETCDVICRNDFSQQTSPSQERPVAHRNFISVIPMSLESIQWSKVQMIFAIGDGKSASLKSDPSIRLETQQRSIGISIGK